ncbi:MAG: peroxide stress protein YaaA [Bradymonadaceae bacterium]
MLILLSPSKRLDYESALPTDTYTQPEFLDDAETLIEVLREYSLEEIRELMDISEDLAELNVGRYESFETPFTPENAKQSIFAFDGDVYRDFAFEEYDESDFEFLQNHVRILSGLYGILRPLDLMQPYRLEMGTSLPNPRGEDLYDFWGDQLAESVNRALDAQEDDIILNLASNQYFDAVDRDILDGRIVSPTFKDERNGSYMVISFYLKRLRGTMSDWVVRNRIEEPSELSAFTGRNYEFSVERSTDDEPVFLRDEDDS